jgi:uncharacterized protein YutE (UPF0331/DUF86 family)
MREVEQSRQVIIEQLVPRLEADGYSVIFEPPRQLLPPFMGSYVPDAIAVRPEKKIAIEVIVEGEAAKSKERDLKRLFENAKDWELNVYFVRPSSRDLVSPVSVAAIETSIRSVEKLASEGSATPALLMCWAIFEALARLLAPEKFRRPQTPGRLVETLANGGYVTPSEAEFLRQMARLRNQLVHGDLEKQVGEADVRKFLTVLSELRAQVVEGIH